MIRKYLLFIVITIASVTAKAQSPSLAVSQILDGKIVPLERMVVTKVRGRTLSQYKLSYYRSARFEASPTEMQRCFNAVKTDNTKANGNSMTKQNKGKGKLSLTFILHPNGKTNRFVSYLHEKQDKNRYRITLIYMEGSVSGLEELEKLIDK